MSAFLEPSVEIFMGSKIDWSSWEGRRTVLKIPIFPRGRHSSFLCSSISWGLFITLSVGSRSWSTVLISLQGVMFRWSQHRFFQRLKLLGLQLPVKSLLERSKEVSRVPFSCFFCSGILVLHASVDKKRNYGMWKREILNRPQAKGGVRYQWGISLVIYFLFQNHRMEYYHN